MSTEEGAGQSGSEAAMSKEGNSTNNDTEYMGILQYQCSGMDLPGSVMKNEEGSSEVAENQTALSINFTEDYIKAMGTLQAEKVHEVIKQFEASFFKDNPRLKKKSLSLLFEIHLKSQDKACSAKKEEDLLNVEVRMSFKNSISNATKSL